VALSARQHVEFFHLVFLRALVARGEDKALFALKGGSNLRFFFRSVRYSEDIDFDVIVVAKGTLKKKVDRLLQSPTVIAPLRTRGIELVEVSAPKQTDTTQRWKAGLRASAFPVPLWTKIEFSRRDRIEGATFEVIEGDFLRSYAVSPFLATHYATTTAIVQKIQALAGRSEPQARDVFDLNHLFAMSSADATLPAIAKARLSLAIENAMSISFDEYSSRVVAYLDPEQHEIFASRDAWKASQDTVVSRLEELR
jgi:predicted nucleotidyltransferase component of viral defense system